VPQANHTRDMHPCSSNTSPDANLEIAVRLHSIASCNAVASAVMASFAQSR
jgi:hypothetical protein